MSLEILDEIAIAVAVASIANLIYPILRNIRNIKTKYGEIKKFNILIKDEKGKKKNIEIDKQSMNRKEIQRLIKLLEEDNDGCQKKSI